MRLRTEARKFEPVKRFGPIREKPLTCGDFRDTLRARWKDQRTDYESELEMGYTIRPMAKSAVAEVTVPEETAKELAELYAFLTENPDQVALAEFDSTDEVSEFGKVARSWARSEGLEYRQLRSANLPDNQIRFTIRVPATEEEKAERRAAREAAKAKGGKGK